MKVEDFLRPGDLLLYARHSLIGWIITVKTWSRYAHCEVYVGATIEVSADGETAGHAAVAARESGVSLYPLRLHKLIRILRPQEPFDLDKAMDWFWTVDGQKYDVLGLFAFYNVGWGSKTRQICSEFATRFYRAGGLEPFTTRVDADKVAPAQFDLSPKFTAFVDVEERGGEYFARPTPGAELSTEV